MASGALLYQQKPVHGADPGAVWERGGMNGQMLVNWCRRMEQVAWQQDEKIRDAG